MAEDRANAFLRMIRRAQRGRLKVYLGYCAGVGKTYQMLQEAHRLRDEGIDGVVGFVETHGRADIARLVNGLEVIPRRRQEYHGVTLEEMDLGAVLARKPQVALVDELAHTNVPGSRNPKRYQDVQDLLEAGIHVITTLNVQHLESLYDMVERATGVKVRERLPDTILAEADQIVDVDLTTEDLRKRLEEGKIYPRERIGAAIENFFKPQNLEQLRELTLRELASQIDFRRRETPPEENPAAPDQVMVCLSSRGPNSETLLRYASRLAGRLNRNWYAVYVQTPSEEPTLIDAQTQRFLAGSLTLAKQLGAMVFTYKGDDVADTILRFAKEYRVGHIIIGRPSRTSLWKKLRTRDVVRSIIEKARGVTIVVLDTRKEELVLSKAPARVPEGLPQTPAAPTPSHPPRLSELLSSRCVVLWDRPVKKEEVLRPLVLAALKDSATADPDAILRQVLKREEQGSTFLNEGVAFPHARVEGLQASTMSLGLTLKGVLDASTEKSVELVFLILSPAETPDAQVQLLGLASRAAQSRPLLQELKSSPNAREALMAIERWEESQDSSRQGLPTTATAEGPDAS